MYDDWFKSALKVTYPFLVFISKQVYKGSTKTKHFQTNCQNVAAINNSFKTFSPLRQLTIYIQSSSAEYMLTSLVFYI